MIAIILAAGDSIFWKWDTRKHLFSLGKEKIIERLQRQLEDREVNYVVVTDDIDVMAASKNPFCPATHNGTIDTIETSREKWAEYDRVVILLGDTVYSKNSLDLILAHDAGVKFFGKEAEVLAVSTNRMNDIHHLPAESTLLEYYELSNCEPMHIFDDYTTDIDTDEQYKEFISNIVNSGKLDDVKND